jgi:hypothetical protein
VMDLQWNAVELCQEFRVSHPEAIHCDLCQPNYVRLLMQLTLDPSGDGGCRSIVAIAILAEAIAPVCCVTVTFLTW